MILKPQIPKKCNQTLNWKFLTLRNWKCNYELLSLKSFIFAKISKVDLPVINEKMGLIHMIALYKEFNEVESMKK